VAGTETDAEGGYILSMVYASALDARARVIIITAGRIM